MIIIINKMNKLVPAGANLVKNIPLTAERPMLIKQMIAANCFFYGVYLCSHGPYGLRYQRNKTLEPESGKQALFFYHFCHTEPISFLFNIGVLSTVGSTMLLAHGRTRFLSVMGLGALGASLFAGYDCWHN